MPTFEFVCTGSPRVAGDDEENFDADDFEDEFQIKNYENNAPDHQHLSTPSVKQFISYPF